MSDRYAQLVNLPVGRRIAGSVGLPIPTPLERYSPGDPLIDGDVLLGSCAGGRLAAAVAQTLAAADVHTATEHRGDLRAAAADAGLDAAIFNPAAPADQRFKALVFDATAIVRSEQLIALRDFFSPAIRRLQANGRMLVLGTPPADASTPREATAQRALEGFTRSLAKEARAGATAQLVYVAPGAENHLDGTLRFLLSPKSAFVDGQVVRIAAAATPPLVDPERPLVGKVALVTGASRGIGAAIAATLARDGAHVVGLDIPALADDLKAVTAGIAGSAITLDITQPDAPQTIVGELKATHGGVDIVVHNAGITRDKTIAAMSAEQWSSVIAVNLSSQEAINDALLESGVLNDAARIVCVASISGIAGNNGQTNYATSKSGVIGMVQALAPVVAQQGATINAVAPGFIETQMTAKVPIAIRQAGRLMSSLSQGGLPVDVAETIAWFAQPTSGGVNGNVVRVCGQALLGA
jgi:3-oxoacyl-[acyl-carrier protein] reductase